MNDPQKSAKPDPDETPLPESHHLRLIRSDERLAGDPEVLIEHDGQTYRLRLTRSGKLILHK
jgi:hemin uptake protein HemP